MNKILWRPSPSNISNSRMTSFIKFVNQRYELSIEEYHELHAWSISSIESFWDSLSTFFNIRFQSKPKNIIKKSNKIYLTQWFDGAKLNYAENMLKPDYLNNVAIEYFDELGNHSSLKYKYFYR